MIGSFGWIGKTESAAGGRCEASEGTAQAARGFRLGRGTDRVHRPAKAQLSSPRALNSRCCI